MRDQCLRCLEAHELAGIKVGNSNFSCRAKALQPGRRVSFTFLNQPPAMGEYPIGISVATTLDELLHHPALLVGQSIW